MTTVPTASMPSALERFDSKYMTRAMHSRSRLPEEEGRLPQDGSASSAARFAQVRACWRNRVARIRHPEDRRTRPPIALSNPESGKERLALQPQPSPDGEGCQAFAGA